MRRRELLALAGTGAAGLLGGCSLPFTGGGGDGDGGEGTATPTMPPIDEAVEISGDELVRQDEGTFAETVEVRGGAQNTSDVQLRGVQIQAEFLNDAGEVEGTRVTDSRDVRSGVDWSFSLQFPGNGSEAAAVTDYELTAGSGFDAPTPTATDG